MNTVNVIEINVDGIPTSLQSFPETTEGNQQAEKLFSRLIEETTDVEIEDALDEGHADVPGGGCVVIFHST